MATLGTKLLNLRREQKLSQSEIAEILDVSQNAYNKWESDKCKPTADNLLKLSQHYHIDIYELLDDNEKISLSGNKIRGENNIIANTLPTINIQSSELIKSLLNQQKYIQNLLENQLKIMEELMKKE